MRVGDCSSQHTTAAAPTEGGRTKLGAEDGSRTRDLRLGKPTFYQLNYFRAKAIIVHSATEVNGDQQHNR